MPPPKPPRRRLPPSDPPGPLIEFRAVEDDAWYSCSTRVEEDAGCYGLETYLRVMYSGLLEELDQRFPAGMFEDADEIEEFRGRFRPHSRQLQDSECRDVAKGTKVCASSFLKGKTADDDVKFYDATVEAIEHSDHKFDKGKEVCTCTFMLLWSHGPNKGNLTPRVVENICVVQDNREPFNHIVDCFLEIAAKKLSLRPPACLDSNAPKFEHRLHDMGLPDIANGRTQVLGDVSMKQQNGGYACELMQTMTHHVDLGGSANLWEPVATDKEHSYFIVVENMEENVSSESIVDFLQKETSVHTQALVFPNFYSEPCSRGVIFVDTREKIVNILKFIGNSDQLIVSSSGRPWVMAEKKYSYGSVAGSLSKLQSRIKSDRNTENILLVRKGSKEFEKGKQLHDLFLEFHKHVQRLHQALKAKERRILHS